MTKIEISDPKLVEKHIPKSIFKNFIMGRLSLMEMPSIDLKMWQLPEKHPDL